MAARDDIGRGQSRWSGRLVSLWAFFRYNAIHVFAGKFWYFFIAAAALLLLLLVTHVLENPSPPTAEDVYYFLLFPAVLLIFYPSVYAIQADADARMLETLFGVPDYRYKVWLARYVTQYVVVGLLLFGLAVFCRLSVAEFETGWMLYHLMFPVVFLGSLGFWAAVLTRSGNGAAVIVVTLFVVMLIAAEALSGSRFNLFHSPFAETSPLEYIAQRETTFYNRVYLAVGSVVCTLFAMLRLMQREKLIG
jgi:hypothetical protein